MLVLSGLERPGGLERFTPMHILKASERHASLHAEVVLSPQILDGQIVVGGRMVNYHTHVILFTERAY